MEGDVVESHVNAQILSIDETIEHRLLAQAFHRTYSYRRDTTSGAASDPAAASQDPAFHPTIARPAYAPGAGPTVLIDQAHTGLKAARHYATFDFGPQVCSFANAYDVNPLPLSGQLQGAVLSVGRGRVAAFAEAGMFSVQNGCGMQMPFAKQNATLLLNVLHGLSHRREPRAMTAGASGQAASSHGDRTRHVRRFRDPHRGPGS